MINDVIVLGAGISGLSAAKFLSLNGMNPIVLEKSNRIGGKAHTIKVSDFIMEEGPNGFLDNKPDTLELIKKSGFDAEILRANEKAKKRFIFSNGKLMELPFSPLAFIKSPLLSIRGKLRLAGEYFVKPYKEDETLADFTVRRFGSEALDKLIGPMASGVYAGDPYTMSVKSAFGKIKEIEAKYGSLFKALIKMKKSSDAAAFGGGQLTSFKEGLSRMINGISEGITIQNNCEVISIAKDKKSFIISTNHGEYRSKFLISALPAYAFSKAVKRLDPPASAVSSMIKYSSVDIAAFGYNKRLLLDGFGYLYSLTSAKSAIGVLWDSSIFPRAGENHCLIRVMIGGARLESATKGSKEKKIELAIDELKRTMNLTETPDVVEMIHHKRAIPQYLMNHKDIIKAINRKEKKYKGLYIIGNAFRGIGLNDCVSAGKKAALSVAAANT